MATGSLGSTVPSLRNKLHFGQVHPKGRSLGISNPPKLRYDGTMKSIPDPDTTPARNMDNFTQALGQILKISKEELKQREKQYQEERATMPKRGPKPKPSASDHASSAVD